MAIFEIKITNEKSIQLYFVPCNGCTFFAKKSCIQSVQSNFYFEIPVGIAKQEGRSLLLGTELNYQVQKNLFSIRYLGLFEFKSFFLFIPLNVKTTNEYALLFGKRYINQGEVFSFSGGISILNEKANIGDLQYKTDNYFGVPLEVNYTFFNNEKERYRIIYGLIPIGKPTAFGRSIGFKLVGNISKSSFIGFGLNLGFGWHKKY